MEEHPIEGLMSAAMNSIRDMVDVNTIIGEPIETSNNIIIIPISKVGFGFASGGSEFNTETVDEYTKRDKDEQIHYKLPFGGGSGAGVSISPVAFLVIQANNVKLMPVCHNSAFDRLLDYVPDLLEKSNIMLKKPFNNIGENQKEEQIKLEKELEKQRRKADQREQQEQNEIKEEINSNLNTENNISKENITTTRVQPRKMRMPRYDIEYDETRK